MVPDRGHQGPVVGSQKRAHKGFHVVESLSLGSTFKLKILLKGRLRGGTPRSTLVRLKIAINRDKRGICIDMYIEREGATK